MVLFYSNDSLVPVVETISDFIVFFDLVRGWFPGVRVSSGSSCQEYWCCIICVGKDCFKLGVSPMSIISIGLSVDTLDRGRGAVAPIDPSERPVRQPDLVEPLLSEQTQSARFVYDREMKRSFVELRDDESGRVISRFPAERSRDVIMAKDIQDAVENAKLLDVLA